MLAVEVAGLQQKVQTPTSTCQVIFSVVVLNDKQGCMHKQTKWSK